uniref:Uncharacterized protein n=1 Tax=Oryza punctata TaxID=4537 RepID=A0A0E0K8Z1_ORYPU
MANRGGDTGETTRSRTSPQKSPPLPRPRPRRRERAPNAQQRNWSKHGQRVARLSTPLLAARESRGGQGEADGGARRISPSPTSGGGGRGRRGGEEWGEREISPSSAASERGLR